MPEQTAQNRVMIFVDFWNYELTMKVLDPTLMTDWLLLPQTIVKEVERLTGYISYLERCFVFGSYDSTSSKDAKLYSWATIKLASMPGMQVKFLPRQLRKKGPCCTGPDHHEIRECPECGSSMLGTQEKGIDTQIVTEMIDKAYAKQCDTIVIVSADKDFVPVVDKLLNNGIKVIHARLSKYGYDLTQHCWGNFDLFKIRKQFSR